MEKAKYMLFMWLDYEIHVESLNEWAFVLLLLL